MVRLKVVILLMLLIASVTLAQTADYYIQVAQPTNLRTSYSLESPVVEIAPADARLHVVYEGTHGNWLQVERNGNKLWMARWVNYSRVSNAQPVPAASSSQPQTEIDNLCFTTWLCNTPEEWVAGWHAFHNSEGVSPSQPGIVQTAGNSYSWSGSGEKRLGPVSLTRGNWHYMFAPSNSWGYLDEATVPDGCLRSLIGDSGFVEVRTEPCILHIVVANNPGAWTLSLSKVVENQQSNIQNNYSWSGHNERRLDSVSLTRGSWHYQFTPTNGWGYLDDAELPSGCFRGFIGDSGFAQVRSEPCTVHITVANNPGAWTLTLSKVS